MVKIRKIEVKNVAKQVFRLDFCGRGLTVETGEVAKQAGGAVLVRYDDTVVLSTATASKQAKEGIDFFPLTVLFEEKLYSVGKIPGGFLRREGRPSEHATLTARMIDRPIRPLFADGFRNEVQVVNTVLSVDQDCTPEMTAMFGASLALCVSDIPFNGPIAGVMVGRVDGEYIINPTPEQLEKSDINLTVAGTKYAVNMVESGAKEVSEEAMLGAIMFGHEHIKQLVAFQEEIAAAVGKEKMEVKLYTVDEDIDREVRAQFEQAIRDAVSIEKKLERYGKIDELTEEAVAVFDAKEYENEAAKAKVLKQVKQICHSIEADEVRRLIIEDKVRPDGRKVDEIRPLDAEVDYLPRVHGSGLFTRGQTQALSVLTLAPMGETQIVDGLDPEYKKRFMHHYNFPQYSVGETGRYGAPGRREIGHGALGERALEQVLPSLEEFPYAIRLVAEVLESNGSSSQASICAGTLALMAGGVPIKAPVAGIAMGLISDGSNYTVLTDIQGLEDHFGDMDFKVAGTREGITALQMDIKIEGINKEIMQVALAQAHEGRQHILNEMRTQAAGGAKELSRFAPRMITMKINPEKIRDVIGKGGAVIRGITEETGATINIEDDGSVTIASVDPQAGLAAQKKILEITAEIEKGQIYEGTVTRLLDFGAIVQLLPGKDGLLHISQIANQRVNAVSDYLKEGQVVRVKVIEADEKGRVRLSMKALLEEKKEEEKKPEEAPAAEQQPAQDAQ